jgi:uncharacterized membrane protein YuzA (DUF378 family)
MDDLNALDWIALILAIIGAINWGLVGLFRFNLVKALLGEGAIARTVYALVGLSGIYLLFLAPQLMKQ